jgi:AraC family transcriptional regulator, ethanolamine operon transcriptional activator
MPEAKKEDLEPTVRIAAEIVGLSEFDPGALAHVVAGAEFEHTRLPGGTSNISLLQCSLPHSVINRGVYSPAVLIKGNFASNAITFGTMLQQNEATILNGTDVRMGTLQLYCERSEISYRAWPDATWFAFVIPRERLIRFCHDHLGEIPKLPMGGVATIEPEHQAFGDQFISSLRDLDRSVQSFRSLPNAARLGQSVEHDLLARIATFIQHRSNIRSNDRRRLRQCDEILRDTMRLVEEDPTDMLDLQSMAKATGLGPRSLQRLFQAEYGLCPQEWFRIERLNRVHEELLNPCNGTSVTHLATRWGFFHLSRFSRYYRELFGEKPSETLARASS